MNPVPTPSNPVPGRGSRTSPEPRPSPRLSVGDGDGVRRTRCDSIQDQNDNSVRTEFETLFATAPRMQAALDATLEHLADNEWHRTADVERMLVEHTDLAPRTVRNLLERASTRRNSPRKPLRRRGDARGDHDTREIRFPR